MQNVLGIKTLPHLQALHVKELGLGMYSTIFSRQILDYFEQAKYFEAPKLKFTFVKKFLADNSFYRRVESLQQPGHYIIKGDLIYIWPAGYEFPLRMSFFDEELEVIVEYDSELNRSIRNLKGVYLSKADLLEAEDAKYVKVSFEVDPTSARFAIFNAEARNVAEQIDYDFIYPQLFWNRLDLFENEVRRLIDNGYYVRVLTKHAHQLQKEIWEMLHHQESAQESGADEIIELLASNIPAGFTSQKLKLAVFTDREIFGTIYLSQRKAATDNSEKLLRQLEGEIEVGDYIVHEDYGIGIYAGLTQEEISGQVREYLEVEFANEDKLLVPVEMVTKLTKFIGNDGIAPALSKLGKGGWSTTQKNLKKLVQIKAKELVEHYARRELANAQTIEPEDSQEFETFVDKFAYTATGDQIRAANEIISDLTKTTPMNRLLVGDVGFGKTEVAMRAAFKVAEAGMQVAVLCPTTVLAAQHYEVFRNRFTGSGIKVEKLSRFNTTKQNKEAVEQINKGHADIVVGTHRLLSKDVKFKNLGLLIIDEEQRFGVAQKERIKQINYGVHQLSISATPIPRTLSMALTNIQDISIIAEAPPNRKPIQTELVKGDWDKVLSAISRELDRDGQIYFVHNRVQTMPSIKAKLESLVPGLRVISAHGQMSPNTLDAAMTDFYERKADVLLATTIIENGLDMPNVNTMIINRADAFGLSQLYQLRGRVGRSERQAYCVLLTTKQKDRNNFSTTEKDGVKSHAERKLALERLEALVDSSDLGSGFSVASKDLEIRGAGDLLGQKQHGHITKVGYALYMQLLAQEIDRLKNQADLLKLSPEYLTM